MDKTGGEERYATIAIIISILLITYLHYSSLPLVRSLHDIYREFYYIPALLGAFVFGLKGALPAYLFMAVLYLPYVFTHWTGNALYETDRLLHFLFIGLFSSLTGFLVDRERRHRKQMEREHYLAGIGQAALTVVHDLKSPLLAILGFARRIQEGKGDSAASVQEIIDSAADMQRIVHDVIDFARPIQLELKEADIRNIISKVHNYCKEKAEKEGIVLTVDLPAEPVIIVIDTMHMERAIINIINNAIEASEKGQQVLVHTAPGKGRLVIVIKDHGSGMDRETLENIFVPFYTKKSRGTGLGMSIAKKVVEGHRGRIHVSSRLGAGTEVKIELPYNIQTEREDRA